MTSVMDVPADIAPGRLSPREYEVNFDDATPPLNRKQALIEAARCYFCYDAPCMEACPTGIDIPSFIRKIATDNVKGAAVTMDEAVARTQAIIDAARTVRDDLIFLSHGGPILTPDDAALVNARTDCVGFVGASSLERIGVESSLVEITRRFKAIGVRGGGGGGA